MPSFMFVARTASEGFHKAMHDFCQEYSRIRDEICLTHRRQFVKDINYIRLKNAKSPSPSSSLFIEYGLCWECLNSKYHPVQRFEMFVKRYTSLLDDYLDALDAHYDTFFDRFIDVYVHFISMLHLRGPFNQLTAYVPGNFEKALEYGEYEKQVIMNKPEYRVVLPYNFFNNR